MALVGRAKKLAAHILGVRTTPQATCWCGQPQSDGSTLCASHRRDVETARNDPAHQHGAETQWQTTACLICYRNVTEEYVRRDVSDRLIAEASARAPRGPSPRRRGR